MFVCLLNEETVFTFTYDQDEEEQRELELNQKKEEDRLYREFHQMRSQEEERALKGVQEEWEVELTKLTAKFEKDLQTKARNKEDQFS